MSMNTARTISTSVKPRNRCTARTYSIEAKSQQGSARASRAGFGGLAETNLDSVAALTRKFQHKATKPPAFDSQLTHSRDILFLC